jgi:parallel beta-helix repeat protein
MTGQTLPGLIPIFLVLYFSPSVTLGGPVENKTIINGGHTSGFRSYQENPAILQAVGQIGGPIHGVAVQDSIAYVTVGPRLLSMRVSESGSLTEIGGTKVLPRFLRDVAVSGTFAYVAAGEAGIYVVDVSDPTHPTVVGSWDSPGYAEAVVVEGETLYLADGPYGLRVVDVTDSTRPVEIGWAFPLHYALDVAVSDGIAAIASVTASLFVADVSNPADPVELGSLKTNGCSLGVDIDGQTVFIADGWGGVVSVDISRPDVPKILASYKTPGWAMDVAVEDGVALVADGFKGMRVLDVSVPSDPEEFTAFEFKGSAVGVLASGGRAYVIDKPSELRVIDISDIFNPAQVSVFNSIGQVEDVAVSGIYAYLASGAGGLHVVDVTDPSAPRRTAQFVTQGSANSVSVVESYAFVTTMHGPEGLEILDISDPSQPVSVGFVQQHHGPYRDLEISGSIAFIADERGLSAVDISDPARPFETGCLDLEGGSSRWSTTGVGVQGTLAAVAQAGDGTVFVDVSDPSNMTVLGRFVSGSDWAWDAKLQGNLAYVADGGIRVLDISDPEDPSEVGFAPSPTGDAREIILAGTVAYLTTAKTGTLAFDVSDPRDPVKITEYDSLGFANRAVVQDGLLYVADGEGGLLVLQALSSGGTNVLPSRVSRKSGRHHGPRSNDARVQTESMTGQFANEWISKRSSSSLEQQSSTSPGRRSRSNNTQSPRIRPLHMENYQQREGPDQTARVAMGSSRLATSTCQVTTTADAGSGSLRSCLEQAESGDTIVFDPAVFPPNNPAAIVLSSDLPRITQGGLTIDASESGVILEGNHDLDHGITIVSDANSVRGLQIYNFSGDGIAIFGSKNQIGGDRSLGSGPVGQGNVCSGNYQGIALYADAGENIITGNLIGTDVTGRQARGNHAHGMHVFGHDNTIGGSEAGERNIVSANGEAGISLHFGTSVGNRVIGNYVGTDIDGTTALGNHWYGIGAEQGPAGNLIEGNLSSGNEWQGIIVVDPGSSYNTVAGNIVGLDASGTKALGNASSGIYVGLTSAWFNRVGGTIPEDRNIVSGNHSDGITVAGDDQFVLGNYVGTDVTGRYAVGNASGIVVRLAEHSFVGGAREDERNVICGNGRGVVVSLSFDNLVMGNYIGVDPSGAVAMPNQEAAHFDESSKDNIFQSNVISGNGAGVTIRDRSERNLLRANRIGVAAENSSPVPNQWLGVRIESASNQIGGPYRGDGNIIAHNEGGGVHVRTFPGNSILGNSIYGNNGPGIALEDGANNSLPAPEITLVKPNLVWGQACVGCVVDVFSDEDGQGRVFEGNARADGTGSFEFSSATRLYGPYITCTATDPEGNTSPFSDPEALRPVPRLRLRVAQ